MSVETKPRSTPVSIVIPVYNRLDLTRQCLNALRRYTADHEHEIIVVDNGSTDGTTDELREMQDEGRLRAVFNQKNEASPSPATRAPPRRAIPTCCS